MCQILFDENQKESDFVLKNSKKGQVLEKVAFKSSRAYFSSAKWSCLPPLCFFKGLTLLKKNSVHCVRIVTRKSQRVRCWINSFRTCQIMNWQTPNVSNFVWKKSQRVLFWNSELTTCQVLLQKFYHMMILSRNNYHVSGLKLKDLQRVRFWLIFPPPVRFCQSFTKCQFLFDENQKESDFELKNSKKGQVLEKVALKCSRGYFCSCNWSCLPPLCFLKGITLKKKTVCIESELSSENHNVLDSELKNLQRVKSCNDKLPKCQILYEKSHNVSISELKGLQRVRFWFKSFSTGRILS